MGVLDWWLLYHTVCDDCGLDWIGVDDQIHKLRLKWPHRSANKQPKQTKKKKYDYKTLEM